MEDLNFSDTVTQTLVMLKQYNRIGEIVLQYHRNELSSEVAMESIQRIMIERI
jgi:hypothetical protein